jgi:hypothetical protein
MLLSGSLEAFRVQDLLALVGRKPGQWLISMRGGPRGRSAFIGLRDRAVVGVSADTTRQDLARRLVLEGAVGTTGLAQALRRAQDSGLGLLRVLVDSDIVEPAILPVVVRQHMVSALASLTHWRTGTFQADVVDQVPDDVDAALPVSELGSEVGALLRHWRPASDMVGGPNTVMAAYPGRVPDRLRGLHSLIDGHRTVADLVDTSGHGDIGTVVDLAALIEAGCATPMTGSMGALEQRLAMLSALETPSQPARPAGPNLSVIPGGAQAADDEAEAEDDLLTTFLKGVRGV